MLQTEQRSSNRFPTAPLLMKSISQGTAPQKFEIQTGSFRNDTFVPIYTSLPNASGLFQYNEGFQSLSRQVLSRSRSSSEHMPSKFKFYALQVSLDTPDWVNNLYKISKEHILDEHIVAMFDALETAIYSDIETLNETLLQIETEKLATEFIVGIPRGLYPLRDVLHNWQGFVIKAWLTLASRKGHDVRELLQGLI